MYARYYIEVRSYDLGRKAILHEVGRWERIEQKITNDLCSSLVCLLQVENRAIGERMVADLYKAEQEGRACEWMRKLSRIYE